MLEKASYPFGALGTPYSTDSESPAWQQAKCRNTSSARNWQSLHSGLLRLE